LFYTTLEDFVSSLNSRRTLVASEVQSSDEEDAHVAILPSVVQSVLNECVITSVPMATPEAMRVETDARGTVVIQHESKVVVMSMQTVIEEIKIIEEEMGNLHARVSLLLRYVTGKIATMPHVSTVINNAVLSTSDEDLREPDPRARGEAGDMAMIQDPTTIHNG
jgi:hypothetical protein